jgi:hypothetical protein
MANDLTLKATAFKAGLRNRGRIRSRFVHTLRKSADESIHVYADPGLKDGAAGAILTLV